MASAWPDIEPTVILGTEPICAVCVCVLIKYERVQMWHCIWLGYQRISIVNWCVDPSTWHNLEMSRSQCHFDACIGALWVCVMMAGVFSVWNWKGHCTHVVPAAQSQKPTAGEPAHMSYHVVICWPKREMNWDSERENETESALFYSKVP